MILKGNQRGNARELAVHLMNAQDNERIELHEVRGFMGETLKEALEEAYAVSRGTRCKQHLFSLSLNPPAWTGVSVEAFDRAIDRIEQRLGLSNHPRAIVFHVKNGRRHAHCVWSRISPRTMKAVNMAHYKTKLCALSREFFLEHGWEMPRGLAVRGERSPLNYTHAEHQQAQRIGRNAGEIKAEVQAAWAQSDSRASLEAALAERGYVLARGDRRDFVIVDRYGEVYSLPRFAGVKTKDVWARLAVIVPEFVRPLAVFLRRIEIEALGANVIGLCEKSGHVFPPWDWVAFMQPMAPAEGGGSKRKGGADRGGSPGLHGNAVEEGRGYGRRRLSQTLAARGATPHSQFLFLCF